MIRWDRMGGEMVVPGFVLGMIRWWCWSKKFQSVFNMRSVRCGGYPRALLVFVGVSGNVVIAIQLEVVGPKRVFRVIGRNKINGGIIIVAIQRGAARVCFIAKI